MRHRTAFTLIELLAASALAAVLMVVLFQVIGSLGRTRAAMAAGEAGSAAPSAWQADLLDALRRDLANATAVRLGPGRVEITGHGALDRHTLAATHEPVTVVYELVVGAPGRWHLVRRQASRGMAAGGRAWSELLCADVAAFAVEPVSRSPHPAVRVDPLATPLRVVLRAGAGTRLDEVIVTR